MAIIEVLFPKLIPDAATVKEAVAHVIPVLTKVLKEADYSRGARGWVVQEDDQDVSADFREIIIIEWPTLEHSQKFVQSQGFGELVAATGPYVTGPPDASHYEVSAGLDNVVQSPVVSLLLISPKDGTDVQSLLEKVKATVEKFPGPSAISGINVDPGQSQIVVVETFANRAEFDAKKCSPSYVAFLDAVGAVAKTTQLVADIEGPLSS